MSKGEKYGTNAHHAKLRGVYSVSINAKGVDCWTFDGMKVVGYLSVGINVKQGSA